MKKRLIVENLIIFILTFIMCFGKINSYIFPFVFAFSFSLVFNKYNVYVISIAILLGLNVNFSLNNLIISLSLVMFLLLFNLFNFSKKLKNKTIIAVILLNLSHCALIFFASYSKISFISSLISLLSANLLYFVYNIFIKGLTIKNIGGIYSQDEKLCFYLIILTLFFSLAKILIFNFYPVYFITLFLILSFSLIFEARVVLTLSLLMGVGISLTNYSISSLAIVLVWGFSAVVLKQINKISMAIGIVIVDVLLGVVFNAYINYSYINLLTSLVAGLLIILIKQPSFIKISAFLNKNNTKIAENYLIYSGQNYFNEKISNLISSFNEIILSYKKMFLKSANVDDLVEFLTNLISSKYCVNCSGKYCSTKEILTENIKSLVMVAIEKDKLKLIDLPSTQNINCNNLNEIISLINNAVAEFKSFNKKTEQQNNAFITFSQNYEAFSVILESLTNKNEVLKVSNKININEAISEFSLNNILVKELVICENSVGNFNKAILIVRSYDAGKLVFGEILSKILGFKVKLTQNIPSPVFGWNILIYETAPKFDLFIGVSQSSKDKVNGDNFVNTKLSNSQIVAISDGMGTGEKANQTSNLCLDLYYNFLKAGITEQKSLEIINKLIIPMGQNNFATMDAVNFNLNNGNVDFIKFGSSTSLIKRQNKIEVIEPESLPIGSVFEARATIVSKTVFGGDYIILASDGVIDAFSNQLIDFIANLKTTNAQMMADDIVEEASFRQNKTDDLTCLVIKVNVA